jgi:SAM-dependent methyltransferase
MNAVKEYYEDFTFYLVRDRIIPNPRHAAIRALAGPVFDVIHIESALDVGCGIGLMAEFMRRRIRTVRALDISERNIAFARETVRDVDFVVSDFLSFPTESSFDLITFFDVLEHFPREKLPDIVRKVSLLSHEETSVLVTIPSAAFARSKKVAKQVVDEEVDVLLLANLFAEAGFELRECHVYELDYQDQYRFLWLARRSANWSPAKLEEPKLTKLLRLTHAPLNLLRYRKAVAPYGKILRRRV